MTRQLIWAGFALRVLVAFWNGFFGPSFGAEGDAAEFHLRAVEFAENLSTDRFIFGILYSYALGTVYHFTVSSLFFGSLLSAIAWLISARVLVRIMRLLQFERRQQAGAMLIYALLPSSILWTGVTMREPYQLLFVNLAIHSSLRIYLHRSRKHWAYLLVAVTAGGLLQPGLFAYGVLLVAGTAAWLLLRRSRGIPMAKLLWVAPLVVAILAYGYSLFASAFTVLFEQGLAGAVELYQQGGLTIDARTRYKESVSIDGLTGLLVFVPVALFQYLFEPMPWRMSSIVDVPPLLENILRAFLLWRAIKALRRLRMPRRRPVVLVFLAYLFLETMFALGTVAWGTAARHHLPGMGLLLVSAYALPRRRRRRVDAPQPPPLAQGVPSAA